MKRFPATLQFNLDDGRGISATEAGQALILWAAAIEEASHLIDPSSPIRVELVGAEAACLRLHAVLRFIEGGLTKADNVLTPYPKLRAALALNVFNLPGMILGGVLGAGIVEVGKHYFLEQPAVQSAASDAATKLQESPTVRAEVQRFYRSVEAVPSVSAVRVYESNPDNPIVSVSRADFSFYSGLWDLEEPAMSRRPRQDVWDVIVTHPVIISKPRVWRFRRDGLPFKAKLLDPYFLSAIRDRTLPMQVAEGTLMRVRVEWFEDLHAGEWVADPSSFVISKVVWPAPLRTPLPLPLLPNPD